METTGWSLVLPDTWSRVRLDDDRRHHVTKLVTKAFATLPRDESFELRRALEAKLASLADTAHENGARQMYVLSDVLRGLPLAATCLVTVVPAPFPAGMPAEIVARTLVTRPGDEPAVLVVGDEEVPAVRRSHTQTFQDGGTGLGPAPVTFTGLDVYVPFPDRERILLLTFQTPAVEVAAAMTVLFEAIAGSLRWRKD